MAFLTRWHDDQSRPTAEGGRSRPGGPRAGSRSSCGGWSCSRSAGLLTDGPLKDLGTLRGADQQEAGVLAHRRSSTTSRSSSPGPGATVSIIGVCLVVVALVWWRTRQWWYAVVPLIAISAAGAGLLLHHAAHRP